MPKRNDQPEPDFDPIDGSQEATESGNASRWIDAPRDEASAPEETSAKRPEGFDELIAPEPATEVLTETTGPAPKPKRSAKTPLLIVGAVILTVALGFFGLMAFDGFQEEQKAVQVQKQEEQKEQEKAKAIKEADNPFSVLVGEVDPPSEDPLAVSVAEDRLTVGGSTLSITGGTLTPTVNPCNLEAITDICLGARGRLGEGDFDVLLVKDVSRTRLLDNPSEFKEIKLSGDTIAARLGIDMGSAEGPDRFGVLTSNGTTGFVLIFPVGTSADRVEEVIKAATVI